MRPLVRSAAVIVAAFSVTVGCGSSAVDGGGGPAGTGGSSGSPGPGPGAGPSADGGPPSTATDPCTMHAWAMAGGCRGYERSTRALAPVTPKPAFDVPVPAGRFVFASVVDGNGVLYVVLGAEDSDFASPARSVARIDPTSRSLETLRDLAPSRDRTSLGLSADGALLVLHDGELAAFDPKTKSSLWTKTLKKGDAARDLRLRPDGSMVVATGGHLQLLDADRAPRWDKSDVSPGATIVDAKGRSFTVTGGALGNDFVGLESDGTVLFRNDIDPEEGWYGVATDGDALYGGKRVRDATKQTSFGALDPTTGQVRWQQPMDAAMPSPQNPFSLAEQLLAVAVVGPGVVLVRTSKRLSRIEAGKTKWRIDLPEGAMGSSNQTPSFFVDRAGTAVLQTVNGIQSVGADGSAGFALRGRATDVLPARDGALWVTTIDGNRRLTVTLLTDP